MKPLRMISPLSELRSGKTLFIRLPVIIILIGFSITGAFADGERPFDMLPQSSVSSNETSFAPLVNPVFPDVSSGPSISYLIQNYRGEDTCNHIFLLNTAGFSFSCLWFNNLYNREGDEIDSVKTRYFKIGKGFFWNNAIGVGLDYSFTRSRYEAFDDYKSLSFGFLFRPFNFISLGFVARDMNSPELGGSSVRQSEVYSISLRPYRDYLTLSFDARRWEGEKFDKSDFLFSGSLHLFYDISISASADLDKNFTCGMSIPLGAGPSTLVFDGYNVKNTTEAPDSMVLGASIRGEKYKSSFIPTRRFLKIVFEEKINEIEAEGLFRERGVIFYDILSAIQNACDDDSIKGILLKIDNAALGMAQIQEIREELRHFRGSGKRVYSILTTSGNKEYYLASVSDEIFFTPSSYFSLTGLKAEVYFFKKLLEKVGVKYESVKKGRYKSFNETFTREHMSPEFRENLLALITDLNDQFINDILKDRGIDEEIIDRLFRNGIMTPGEALNAGFIDSVEYPGDALNIIMDRYRIPVMSVEMPDYLDENFRTRRWGPVPRIAIVYAAGSIVRGDSKGGIFSSEVIGDDTYRDAVYAAFKDRSVRAVVIRVDSPGGSAAASELMWHYLMEMKEKYPYKPVVFSFGNTAASGGYFISSTGSPIFGSRGSITGSIGVISGKLSLEKLYGMLGINRDVIKMSEFADIFSEADELTEAEREVLQRGVDFIYNRFTGKVEKYRGIKKEKIPEVAEGRVFTGNQAEKNRLVDNIGGLLAALRFARVQANIRGEYEIRHLPRRETPLLNLFEENITSRLSSEELKILVRNLQMIDFKDELALYFFPYHVVIK